MNARSLLIGPLATIFLACIIAGIYWSTFYGLAIHGDRSDAASRPAFVIVAFLWMLWELREKLLTLPTKAYWPGLVLLLLAGLTWLLGELIFVRVLTNLAAVAMIPCAILAVVGRQWISALQFPLCFLIFIVPFGGPLVPMLVEWTANVAFWSLDITGLPVNREGAYFELSTGKWSVAEACSGVEYLTTCLMLGTLFAWRMYHSTAKRLLFVAAAVFVGIAGNWLRVYLTISLAHFTGNAWLRDSHGTFGWLLFAVLMGILGFIGWCIRDEEVTYQPAASARNSSSIYAVLPSLLSAVAILLSWPLVSYFIKSTYEISNSRIPDLVPQNGWAISSHRASDWVPDLQNPRELRIQSFQKGGQRVDVVVALFKDVDWSSQLVTSVNQLANSDNQNWSLATRGSTESRYLESKRTVDTALLIGRTGKVIIWRWYWLNGRLLSSNIGAKLYQLTDRFDESIDMSAWVAISTEINSSPGDANRILASFIEDMDESFESSFRPSTLPQR